MTARAKAMEAPIPPRTIDEARAFLLGLFNRVAESEEIPVPASLGRVVAVDIAAPVDLPRFDTAAMDGYAVRTSDLRTGEATRLRITGRSLAGHPAASGIGSGEAARIFTGAVMPSGADRVFKQEDCLHGAGWVSVLFDGAGKVHVRRKGEDFRQGSTAIREGTRVDFRHLAILGALSIHTIPVYRPLRVALFSTGDEVRPVTVRSEGLIGDANRPMLHALLRECGCAVNDGGVVPDNIEALTDALRIAAQDNDLIITTGGMSVGDEDHLTKVIRSRGYLEFWRLNIRPGKPVGFGDIDDCPILALPGNPLAALATFLLLGVPLVARLSGDRSHDGNGLWLPLHEGITKKPGYVEVMPGVIRRGPGGASCVEPIRNTGSARLSALVAADCLIILPEHVTSLGAGEAVNLLPLCESFRQRKSMRAE